MEWTQIPWSFREGGSGNCQNLTTGQLLCINSTGKKILL